MDGARILVVEDDHIIATIIRKNLNRLGFSVSDVVASGEEAIRKAEDQHLDLVLMDIQLKGDMDGVEAAEQIRTRFDIPVVYLTAHDDAETLKRAKVTEPFGYILKPLERGDLRIAIEIALHKHEMEKRLKESEARYRIVSELTSDYAYSLLVDNDGTLVSEWITDAFSRITGFAPEELEVRGGWHNLIYPEDVPVAERRVKTLLSNQPDVSEIRIVARSGQVRWLRIYGRPVWDSVQGRVVRIIGAAQDITHRKQAKIELEKRVKERTADLEAANQALHSEIAERERAEKEIRRQAARAEAMLRMAERINTQLDLNSLLSVVCQETARVLNVSAAGIMLYDTRRERFDHAADCGLKPAFLEGFKPIPRELYEQYRQYFGSPIVIPEVQEVDDFPNAELCAEQDVSTVVIAGMYSEGRLIGILNVYSVGESQSFLEDDLILLQTFASQAAVGITKARLFEQVRAGRQRLQTLSKRLVEVQEEERRYLASELHDQIGSVLTGLQFYLGAGKNLSREELLADMAEAHSMVTNLMEQVRELSLNLRPAMLDDLGLLPTLLWYFDRYTVQTGVRVDFTHSGIEERFSPELETAAYRIVQEALTNVARHSGADQVVVNIKADGHTLKVHLEDQGRGFDPARVMADKRSFGLVGMRERASFTNGQLEIQSIPEKGTTLIALFPVDRRPLERRNDERIRITGG